MDFELTTATRLRQDPDVLFQKVQGDVVILDLKTGVYMGVDEIGARFWELISERETVGAVIDAMTAEYDVSRERLERDLLELCRRMVAERLLIPVSEP